MTLSHAIYAIRWLIRDTFRQAVASRLMWVMLGVSLVCVVFCASLRFTGDIPLTVPDGPLEMLPRTTPPEVREKALKTGVLIQEGELTLAFGAIRLPLERGRPEAVRHLQLLLAGVVADTVGLLLALVWTAGFLPTFLEPSAASVLLAKPIPRWTLLVGKYLGVLAFVAFQALIFVGGTWLALGVRSGVWDWTYLLCVPLLLVHFAIFFSFSTLLAVVTRSTVACVIGSILFWMLCWGMNFGRHALVGLPEVEAAAASFGHAVELGYWVLPKPADMCLVLFDSLEANNYFGKQLAYEAVERKGEFYPELSVVTSLLFAALMLGLAAYEFVTTDY